jgi:c-di-GMP-binding flagellar brake protein YcgR
MRNLRGWTSKIITFDTFGEVSQRIVWTLICSGICGLMSVSLLPKARHFKQKNWRRRHSRHRADFPLKATSLREDGYADIRGRCSDIGTGGMGAVLTAEIPSGEVVSLEFSLPVCSQAFAVRAIVRYRRGFMHGMEFIGLSPEQQSDIHGFCASLEVVD